MFIKWIARFGRWRAWTSMVNFEVSINSEIDSWSSIIPLTINSSVLLCFSIFNLTDFACVWRWFFCSDNRKRCFFISPSDWSKLIFWSVFDVCLLFSDRFNLDGPIPVSAAVSGFGVNLSEFVRLSNFRACVVSFPVFGSSVLHDFSLCSSSWAYARKDSWVWIWEMASIMPASAAYACQDSAGIVPPE